MKPDRSQLPQRRARERNVPENPCKKGGLSRGEEKTGSKEELSKMSSKKEGPVKKSENLPKVDKASENKSKGIKSAEKDTKPVVEPAQSKADGKESSKVEAVSNGEAQAGVPLQSSSSGNYLLIVI